MNLLNFALKAVIVFVVSVLLIVVGLAGVQVYMSMVENRDNAVYTKCVGELASKGQCFEIAFKH